MRIIMLPAMAVAFAAAPIAGQNFGARKPERVRETFNWTVGLSIGIMLALTRRSASSSSHLLHAHLHVRRSGGGRRREHAHDHVVELRRERHHLQLLVDVPGARQHLADHRLEHHPPVRVHRAGDLAVDAAATSSCVHVWYLSVCSMFLQAVVSFALLRREFRRKLTICAPGQSRRATPTQCGTDPITGLPLLFRAPATGFRTAHRCAWAR